MTKSTSRSQSLTSSGSIKKARRGQANGGKMARLQKFSEGAKCDQKVLGDQTSQVLPMCTPLLVFIATLTIRVFYVMDRNNWWMVHPDEVYQSMEVAHIEVYGYGFRTFEFAPHEPISDDVTRYRQMELNASMYALRSPVFPYFYVLVSYLASLVGVERNPYVLWRCAHVIVSSLLPLAVYRHVTKLYDSAEKGSISALLVASSVHLNVFGTHCLLHSFLAPFTFLALSLLNDGGGSEQKVDSVNHKAHHGLNLTASDPGNNKSKVHLQSNNINNNNNNLFPNRNKVLKTKDNSMNGNGLKSQFETWNNVKSHLFEKTVTGRIKRLILEESPLKSNIFQLSVAMFIATLTCYIRPDVLLVYTVNLVFSKTRCFLCPANMAALTLGIVVALSIGIGSDFTFHGWGVLSPVNWVYFNVIKGLSKLFGTESYQFYFKQFFCMDIGVMMLMAFTMLALLIIYMKHRSYIHVKQQNNEVIREDSIHANTMEISSFKSLVVWSFLFMVYSLNGHKEPRLIHDMIILVFIFIADVLVNIKHIFQSQKIWNNILRIILVLFAVFQWRAFPGNDNSSEWAYQGMANVEEVNSCIKYISEQNDTTGVFYDKNLFMTGGMSLLHHDVTVLSLIEDGFYEFGLTSRRNYTSVSNLTTGGNPSNGKKSALIKSVNEFSRASNYITRVNSQAVLRVIIRNKLYNYLVVRQDRRFLDFGFTEVFTTKHYRVFKRSLDARSEDWLEGVYEKIPQETNSTILLHEGDVLFNMNQFKEASDRFYKAVSLDEKLVEAYLPLQLCYSKLGDNRASRAVRGKCLALFNEEACSRPRRIISI